MRKRWAVAIAILICAVFIAIGLRADRAVVRKKTDEIALEKPSSKSQALLTTTIPKKDSSVHREPPSPKPYPADSICGFLARAWKGNPYEYHQALVEKLQELLGQDDPKLNLMKRLVGNDLREVEDADRDLGTEESKKIALLARLGLVEGANLGRPTSSVSADDLQLLEEMRTREPHNGFWPLAEHAVKKREGIPTSDEDAYGWARSPQATYEDPMRKFYASIRRAALQDDQAFFSFVVLAASAPVSSYDLFKTVRDEIPAEEGDRDLERDDHGLTKNDSINAVGVAMTESQFDPTTHRALDGFTGDAFTAMLGLHLSGRATHDATFNPREVYRNLRKEFQPFGDETEMIPSYDLSEPDTCREKGFHQSMKKLRRMVKEFEKAPLGSDD